MWLNATTPCPLLPRQPKTDIASSTFEIGRTLVLIPPFSQIDSREKIFVVLRLRPLIMSITRTLRSFLSYSLVSLAICGPYIRSSSPLQERQSGEDVVSGVGTRDENGICNDRRLRIIVLSNTLPGNVYSRREVRDLKDNFPDQWNLYLLGLDSLQKVDQYDPYSYYSLAGKQTMAPDRLINTERCCSGIHGRPYKTWGNAPGLEHKIGTEGYCPHSNRLFVGWHRPYLTFFEVSFKDKSNSVFQSLREFKF